MRVLALLAFVVALLLPRAARAEEILPARIDGIRIEGLVRTEPYVVRRELGFVEGEVVTKERFDLAVTRLWNTTIFARVEGEVVREGDAVIAILRLEDRWTLNPLFRFGSGGDAFFFRLGA
jgi:outer membrane protein assembly factor BamA